MIIKYMSKSSIKDQALVDFNAKFSDSSKVINNGYVAEVCATDVKKTPIWKVFMDNAHNFKGAGLGVFIPYHNGNYFKYSIRMDFQVTNNIAKYEVAIF